MNRAHSFAQAGGAASAQDSAAAAAWALNLETCWARSRRTSADRTEIEVTPSAHSNEDLRPYQIRANLCAASPAFERATHRPTDQTRARQACACCGWTDPRASSLLECLQNEDILRELTMPPSCPSW